MAQSLLMYTDCSAHNRFSKKVVLWTAALPCGLPQGSALVTMLLNLHVKLLGKSGVLEWAVPPNSFSFLYVERNNHLQVIIDCRRINKLMLCSENVEKVMGHNDNKIL